MEIAPTIYLGTPVAFPPFIGMADFPIEPDIEVKAGPRLSSIRQATEFLRRMSTIARSIRGRKRFAVLKQCARRRTRWRLREHYASLQTEQMLASGKDRQHARNRVNNFSIDPGLRVRGAPDRIVRSTEAALLVRELLTQRPDPN